MKVEALLQVLREEFTLTVPEVDGALMQWLSSPDDPATAAEAATLFDRLGQAGPARSIASAAPWPAATPT